jgi:endonuclease-8
VPEGDTLFKVACYMAQRLAGHELAQVWMAGAPLPLLARRKVVRVHAWGKHLLVTLAPEGPQGYVMRVHLGMHGSWHSYAPHTPPQRPVARSDVALLRADGHRFVCYGPQDAEVLRVDEVPRSAVLGRLGPDLLAPTFDAAGVLQRLDAVAARTPLIDVLLDQNIAAGLGNVYKSELLFLYGLHPLTPKTNLAQATLQQLFLDGRTLLQRNLGGWPRTTTFDRSQGAEKRGRPRYFVYGRHPAPCLRCGTPIERARWGRHGRSCYFCPRCQPERTCSAPVKDPQPQVSRVP